ncbi:hypothetical protein PG995_011031 [Apiospora arundinis]
MLRWHLDSCSQPKVRAQKEDLSCQACGQSISHQAPLPDHRKFRALSQAPTERTCLDLKWPESVEYTQECILQSGGRDLTGALVEYLGRPSKLISESGRLETLSRYGFPVLPSEQHIRVLLLSPALKWGHPLHGGLQVQDLDGRPYYEALSYTWSDETGDASLNRRIYIGPAWDVMPITRSCSRALRRLRFDNLTRPVWVDAICINQLNNAEKSHQIALMRKIYVKSIRCIVDLGEPSAGSNLALDGLNGTLVDEQDSSDSPITTPFVQRVTLVALLSRPYFRRIWIIQEITSSPQVQVICGSRSADLRLLRKFESMLPPWMNILSTQIGLSQLESSYEGPKGLLRFLRDTRESESSDPRDKIFALLGLIRSLNGKDSIITDYDLTYPQVCTGLAAYCLRHKDLNHLICLRGTRLPSLPSWVPNWGDLQQDDWDDFGGFVNSNAKLKAYVDKEDEQWDIYKKVHRSKVLVRKSQWEQVLEATGDPRACDTIGIVRLQISQSSHLSEPEVPIASSYTPHVHFATGALIQGIAVVLEYESSILQGTFSDAYKIPIFHAENAGYLDLVITNSASVDRKRDSVAVIENQHGFFHIRKEADGVYRIVGDAMLVFFECIPGWSGPDNVELIPANFHWKGPLYTVSLYDDHIARWCELVMGIRELWELFVDPSGSEGTMLSFGEYQQHKSRQSYMFSYRTLSLEEVYARYLTFVQRYGGSYNVFRQWAQTGGKMKHDDGSLAQLIQCVLYWGQPQPWQSLNEAIPINVPAAIITTHRNAWVIANIVRQRWLAVESIMADMEQRNLSHFRTAMANEFLGCNNSHSYIYVPSQVVLALWEELTDNLVCRLNAIADIGGFSTSLFEAETSPEHVTEKSPLDEAFDEVLRGLEKFYKTKKRHHNPSTVKLPSPNPPALGSMSLCVDSGLNLVEEGNCPSSPRCKADGETPCIACISLQDTRDAVNWKIHWKIPKSRSALKGALDALHIQHFGDRRRWAVHTNPQLGKECRRLGILANMAASSLRIETVAII